MQEYVARYLSDNPPLLVIGPNKPGIPSLWFNTRGSGESGENEVLRLSADGDEGAVYAELTDDDGSIHDFDIL
jgi:hypothetical protein